MLVVLTVCAVVGTPVGWDVGIDDGDIEGDVVGSEEGRLVGGSVLSSHCIYCCNEFAFVIDTFVPDVRLAVVFSANCAMLRLGEAEGTRVLLVRL